MTNYAPPLPLPEPQHWITIQGAAEQMGCSRRTVERLIAASTLATHRPLCGKHEVAPVLLWKAEVDEIDRARRRIQARRG